MKIELRSVKYAAFASHETPCFEADVWIDGVRAGRASNEGFGGGNSYSRDLAERLNAHAKTLPPATLDGMEDENGQPMTVEPDADLIIGDLLDEWLMTREYRRAIKKAVLFQKADGRLYNLKHGKYTPAEMLANRERYSGLRAAKVILNTLPEDEALRLYKTSAR